MQQFDIYHCKELLTSKLFHDFEPKELHDLLKHCDYYIKEFTKGNEIYNPESAISHAGIILSGEVDVLHRSINGHEELVGRNAAGDIIGPAFCITGLQNNLSYFHVSKDASLLFLDIQSMIKKPTSSTCYGKFILNLTNILATNNIILNRKIQLLTQKSLREKLMLYFLEMANKNDGHSFLLPFTREQLAQYVCSERSSVSRELGKMQDDNLIRINGNQITVLYDAHAYF